MKARIVSYIVSHDGTIRGEGKKELDKALEEGLFVVDIITTPIQVGAADTVTTPGVCVVVYLVKEQSTSAGDLAHRYVATHKKT